MKRLVNIVPFLLLLSLNINGQITVDPGNTAPFDFENIIENVFLGNGVEIVDVKYFGDPKAVGVFANAENVIGLNRGIIMTTGHATDAVRNSDEFANEDTTQDQLDDEDLESLLVNNIDLIDIAKYEISFIPTSDTLRFRYVFASEEYPDFVCTSTNDVFGFFINGPDPDGGSYDFKNIALVPDPSDPSMNTFLDFPVSVNFVNGGMPGNSVPVSPYC
ncbi:MAG: choice-of-anchor L domain-containing protein, partial [Bacteroidia bacterium]|nr:choice-of-anchor L domain-containing protein [Bacteroidia bacterium]